MTRVWPGLAMFDAMRSTMRCNKPVSGALACVIDTESG